MLKLLVHADDFGLSEEVNEGILRAHSDGILTSTSIMANGAAFEHAVGIARATPSLDVGIHFTLIEERPVLDPREIPSLVGKDGRFHPHITTLAKRYLQGKVCPDEVRRELAAQIRKIRSHGISISHADSHQHAHMLPAILRATLDLANEHDIPHIRFPREKMRAYMFRDPGYVLRLAQLIALGMFCHLGRSKDVSCTDHFVGFFHGGRLGKKQLETLLQHLPPSGTCELMCHPGLDSRSTKYNHWDYRWSDELQALLDRDIGDALRRRGIDLISYRHLNTRPGTEALATG
jgi:hopanoid biosynthesis associated protein HpnK